MEGLKEKTSSSTIIQKADKKPQIIAALAATIGAFGLGVAGSWASPALPHITEYCDDDGTECYCESDEYCPLSESESSWASSLFNIGALISCFGTGILMQAIGMKWTMIATAIPTLIGWILLTIAGLLDIESASIFYIGRILTGMGTGAFSLAAPVYISETAETSIRGALGSLMQLMITLGVFFVNTFGIFLDWVVLTGICIALPVIMAGVMIFMPESPYYLLFRGKEESSRKSLQWLRGKNYDIDRDMLVMKATLQEQQDIGSISFKEFLTVGIYIKPGLIMLALMFFQQYSGINAVLFNLNYIFEKVDIKMDTGVAASVVTLFQVLATLVTVLVVEKFGRKILLILSDSIMAISICALAIYFYLDENLEVICDDTITNSTTFSPMTTMQSVEECVPSDGFSTDTLESLSWLPLTSLIIYIIAFSIGFGPLPWTMNGEFFSLEAKNIASTLASSFNWLCAFLVTKFEYNIEQAINTSGAFFMYAGICAVGTIFVFVLVPETKGKSPNDMKEYFAKRS